MKVTAIVELSKDGLFGIYISDELPGFGLNGTGNSVEIDVKQIRKVNP